MRHVTAITVLLVVSGVPIKQSVASSKNGVEEFVDPAHDSISKPVTKILDGVVDRLFDEVLWAPPAYRADDFDNTTVGMPWSVPYSKNPNSRINVGTRSYPSLASSLSSLAGNRQQLRGKVMLEKSGSGWLWTQAPGAWPPTSRNTVQVGSSAGAASALDANVMGTAALAMPCDMARECNVQRALAGTKWRISLNIGREEGSHYAERRPEWGASGARLLLPIDIEFAAEPADLGLESVLGQDGVRALRPLGDAKFISMAGEQTVRVEHGGWQVRATDNGQFVLRFCVEFPGGAVRNDVTLPARRVYFQTSIWDDAQLSKNEAELAALHHKKEQLQEALDKELDEGVDKNIIGKLMGIWKGSKLLEEKQYVQTEEDYLRHNMPVNLDTLNIPSGFRTGTVGPVRVYEQAPWFRLSGDEYHLLGTFTLRPLDVS